MADGQVDTVARCGKPSKTERESCVQDMYGDLSETRGTIILL